MKEICDQWKKEMDEIRKERRFMIWERRLMWGLLIAVTGVKPYLYP